MPRRPGGYACKYCYEIAVVRGGRNRGSAEIVVVKQLRLASHTQLAVHNGLAIKQPRQWPGHPNSLADCHYKGCTNWSKQAWAKNTAFDSESDFLEWESGNIENCEHGREIREEQYLFPIICDLWVCTGVPTCLTYTSVVLVSTASNPPSATS